MKLLVAIVVALLAVGCNQKDDEKSEDAFGTLTDSRDGKTYKTVKIGNAEWMVENLNFNALGSYCYDNDERNCNKFGRLYKTANAATFEACPAGWHVPDFAEWEELFLAVGIKKECESFGYVDEPEDACDYLVWKGALDSLNKRGFGVLMANGWGNDEQADFVVNKRKPAMENAVCLFANRGYASDYCSQDPIGAYYVRCRKD